MRVSGLVLGLEIVGAVPLESDVVDKELHLIGAFVVLKVVSLTRKYALKRAKKLYIKTF